jgi:hypothetical protein
MKFQFSIRNAAGEAWQSFWRHPWFFVGMIFIMGVLSSFRGSHNTWWLVVIVSIAELIWTYVWLSVSLAAADGKEDILNFKSISIHMPNFRQFFTLLGLGIVTALIVVLGLVLIIIPGLYFAVRLAFAQFSYVDHQGTIKKSLEHSWHLVEGRIFWLVVVLGLAEIGIMILGLVALIIGILVAYPVILLLSARFYRALDNYHRTQTTVPPIEMN